MRRVVPAVLLLALGVLPACRGGVLARRGGSSAGGSSAGGSSAGGAEGATTVASVAVPDVRGRPIAAARMLIEGSGFIVGTVEPWPDALGYPSGAVVAQRPARDSALPLGSPVELRVYGISASDAAR